ncbi:hypothetical protein ABW19_dt0206860 [Dactylella cylindrospora]|nr:hypothetical protein ABW19_dt0206860 [Dactylella cylindrospora]
MKSQLVALWASSLLGLAAARPAQPCNGNPTTIHQAQSVTIAAYDGAPSGMPVGHEKMAKLLPGVFWDDDLDDLKNLAPNPSCKLFYAEHNDARRPGQIAQADYKMKYPTVALEHSRHVKSVSCSRPDHMDITFKSRQAYEWAKKNWIPYNSQSNDTMVFVGRFEGCNPTKTDGMRSWSLVDDVTFNDDTFDVDATIQYKDIKDVVDVATIRVGRYIPNKGPKTKSLSAATSYAADPTPAQDYQRPSFAAIATATPTPGQYEADYGKWGSDFDAKKDQQLGYIDATKPRLRPRITPAPKMTKALARVEKRWGWNPFENLTSAWNGITDGVKDIASDVSSVFVSATSVIESAVKAIATDAADIINEFTSYTSNLDFRVDINADASNGVSPFNDAPGRLLVDNLGGISLYCVDCRAQGSAVFSASITFSLLHGIEEGSIDFNGNLKAAFSLGIINTNTNVLVPLPIPAEFQIFNVGLPSLSIPNVFTIGPYIALDIVGTLSVGATGKLRAGFELEFEKPSFHADLKDLSKSTASGWEPKFKPIVDFQGNFSINAQLQTPISLNFGINVLNGKFEKALSLQEAPTVKLSLIQGANFTTNPDTGEIEGGFTNTTGTCPGSVIALRVGLDTIIALKGTILSYTLFRLDLYKQEWCIEHNLFDLNKRQEIDPPNSGFSVGRLSSASEPLSLISGTNGNVYVDSSTMPEYSNGNDTSYQWIHYNNLVVGSKDGRLLYTYSDELAQYGVARVRLGHWESVPRPAEQVVLVPNNDALTAVDLVEGAKLLESPEFQDTVTGGEVHSCGFMKWKSQELAPFTLPTTN